jgi:hypothetical protein
MIVAKRYFIRNSTMLPPKLQFGVYSPQKVLLAKAIKEEDALRLASFFGPAYSVKKLKLHEQTRKCS